MFVFARLSSLVTTTGRTEVGRSEKGYDAHLDCHLNYVTPRLHLCLGAEHAWASAAWHNISAWRWSWCACCTRPHPLGRNANAIDWRQPADVGRIAGEPDLRN